MIEENNAIVEGRLTFHFEPLIQATKYDDWSFYRNQFNNAFGGAKAIDLIVIDSHTTWLIEIKDYRAYQRTKPIDIGDEMLGKVRDTLIGLVAAKFNANDQEEKRVAKRALGTNKLRVVLHLEQPQKHSRLFPRAINPVDVIQKLKQKLKSIDAHPIVVDQFSLKPEMKWTVEG
ncbi:hypothetical protein [Shewanella sp. CG12_big_fil_rev_8_21_14_0_65_47_15]|uniref:hypothetical protein n=1 Tax=Shewanella sp. CG12_big_fil_rev_8_21_14_0_65_47_15 TaxID=1975537 RepID=UPI0025F8B156|nr:hypothetical protein [Shewanella sp. CG12_big_fil_rev_8_21_14_0_65_47_15]